MKWYVNDFVSELGITTAKNEMKKKLKTSQETQKKT